MSKAKFDRQRVRVLIEAKNMRVYQLAKACSVSPEYMSQVLTGKKKPSEGLSKLVAYVLDDAEVIAKGLAKAKAS